jgi:hypothetical protein
MWGFSECRAVSHLLWNYSADRLSADERALVERHVSICDACRAEADAYRQTVDALASMRRDGIPQSRRGWRELQTRLSEPQVRAATSRSRWGLPLAWSSFIAVAGALAVLFFSNQPVNNSASLDPGNSSGGRIESSDPGTIASAETQDPLDLDEAFVDTSPDPAISSQLAIGHRVRRGSRASQRSLRRPIQYADARLPSHQTYSDGIHSGRRTVSRSDTRHLDGAGSSASSEAREYVLAPVSATSDSESGANYVMGSVMMNARTADTEEARGL